MRPHTDRSTFSHPHRTGSRGVAAAVAVLETTRLQEQITALDWKIQDVVIVPVEKLPEEADPGR